MNHQKKQRHFLTAVILLTVLFMSVSCITNIPQNCGEPYVAVEPAYKVPTPVTDMEARKIARDEILASLRLNPQRFHPNSNGYPVMPKPYWLRDHIHATRGTKYYNDFLIGFLDYCLTNQFEDGFVPEIVTGINGPDNNHYDFVGETQRKIVNEHKMIRLQVEADIEYLTAEAVFQIWQATGNDEWMISMLPYLQKAIDYLLKHPIRFNKEHGLVMRPFTIDTWDFCYVGDNRMVNPNDPMTIMHGDNSGVYQALNIMAFFYDYIGEMDKAKVSRNKAEKIMENMFKYLWNGKFFIHQLHLNSTGANEETQEDENNRLSLSNTNDITRGVTNLSQSRSIIETYMERFVQNGDFAEWYSIDPPYEQFKRQPRDRYINGGLLLFVGAELARAAFHNGYETYGYDLILRMEKTIADKGLSFFYDKHGEPRSGSNWWGPPIWGAGIYASALNEGLYGVVDRFKLFRHVHFSPKLVVADITSEFVEVEYAIGNYTPLKGDKTESMGRGFVKYQYNADKKGQTYHIESTTLKFDAHILLPAGKMAKSVRVDGKKVVFRNTKVAESPYVDFTFENTDGKGSYQNSIKILYKDQYK